jgi:hypothetical protein
LSELVRNKSAEVNDRKRKKKGRKSYQYTFEYTNIRLKECKISPPREKYFSKISL